jgi:hypothetical protein
LLELFLDSLNIGGGRRIQPMMPFDSGDGQTVPNPVPQQTAPTPTRPRDGPCVGAKASDLDYSKVRDYYKGSHLATESAEDHIKRNHIDPTPGKSRYVTDPPQSRDAMFAQVSKLYNSATFAFGVQVNTVNNKGDLVGVSFVFKLPPVPMHPNYPDKGSGWIGIDRDGSTTLFNNLHLDPDCKTVRNSYPGNP